MAEIGIYEAMRTLRAVRRLRPDPVPDDVLNRVLEAATWAPTGGNRQPWRIVVVKDPARKERLGALYAAQWTKFELAIVLASPLLKQGRAIAWREYWEPVIISARISGKALLLPSFASIRPRWPSRTPACRGSRWWAADRFTLRLRTCC